MNSEFEKLVNSFVNEIELIQKDINIIECMEISEEAKRLPLKELEEQKEEAKKKMLDYINTL